MNRLHFQTNEETGISCIIDSPSGEYVLFDDHLAEITALQKEIENDYQNIIDGNKEDYEDEITALKVKHENELSNADAFATSLIKRHEAQMDLQVVRCHDLVLAKSRGDMIPVMEALRLIKSLRITPIGKDDGN